ncbi:hypothetical protein FOA52_002366 [Chlamydomonas sp. UWO 241]|nr:hypothetical protein FOA52_002366 [Chlamydomonas sp. UWO 241]
MELLLKRDARRRARRAAREAAAAAAAAAAGVAAVLLHPTLFSTHIFPHLSRRDGALLRLVSKEARALVDAAVEAEPEQPLYSHWGPGGAATAGTRSQPVSH